MKLTDYLSTLPKGGRTLFARAVGVSPAYLYQIEQGLRKAKVELAARIDRESGGAVPREETRPDIDWKLLA